MAICSACGATIKWIKTKAGKNMPVDPTPLWCVLNPESQTRAVTANGKVLAVDYADDDLFNAFVGYVPHWATCPQANRFKKQRDAKKGV